MFEPLNIEPATVDDIPQLVQLVNSAYRGDSSRAGWTTEADLLGGTRITEAALKTLLANPKITILKAADSMGGLLGCVQLELQKDALYLGMLTVSPLLQNSGIGKQLLFAGEAWAEKNGCSRMRISVITVRNTLIAWYQRHGYQATGEKQPFPTGPEFGLPKQPLEFIILEKQL